MLPTLRQAMVLAQVRGNEQPKTMKERILSVNKMIKKYSPVKRSVTNLTNRSSSNTVAVDFFQFFL